MPFGLDSNCRLNRTCKYAQDPCYTAVGTWALAQHGCKLLEDPQASSPRRVILLSSRHFSRFRSSRDFSRFKLKTVPSYFSSNWRSFPTRGLFQLEDPTKVVGSFTAHPSNRQQARLCLRVTATPFCSLVAQRFH